MIFVFIAALLVATSLLTVRQVRKGKRSITNAAFRYYLFSCRIRGVNESGQNVSNRIRILIAGEHYSIAETDAQHFVTACLSSSDFVTLTNVATVWTKGRIIDKKIAAEEQGVTLRLLREIQKETKKIAIELESNCDQEVTLLLQKVACEIAIQIDRAKVAFKTTNDQFEMPS